MFNKFKNIFKGKEPSLSSIVPYVCGHTSLIIYNFWSTNYGIRSVISAKFSLMKKGNVVKSFKTNLPVKGFIIKDLNEFFPGEDGDCVQLEIKNPKLPKNHFANQFRFWGMYSDWSSIVHSMPTTSQEKIKVKSSRRNFPFTFLKNKKGHTLIFHKSSYETVEIKTMNKDDYSSHPQTPYGFSLATRANKNISKSNITGVWHDAPYTRNIKITNNLSLNNSQLFQVINFIPLKGINAYISFAETLTKKSKIEFFLLNIKTNKVLQRKKILVDPFEMISIKDIFKNIDIKAFVILRYLEKESLIPTSRYAHVIYDYKNQTCDSVHSHALESQIKLGQEKLMFDGAKSRRCLKFLPFNLSKNKATFITINGDIISRELLFRVFDNENREKVFYVKILPCPQICFEIKDLLKNYYGKKIPENGIIQIESSEFNPSGNFYIVDKKNNTVAVDHFTGG